MATAICNYVRLDDGNIECPSCKHRRAWTRTDTLPKRNCTSLLRTPASGESRGCGGCGGKKTLAEKAWNLAGAIGRFIAEPGFVTGEDYQQRLAVCDACPRRDDATCRECGCVVSLKARLSTENCPLAKWTGDHPNTGNWWHDEGRVTYRKSDPLQVADRSRVLLSFGHGLGDNVFFACVLRHLRRHRPDLAIDVQANCGNHSLFRGLAGELFCLDPTCGKQPTGHYDLRYSYPWPEPSEAFPDGRSHKLGKTLWEVHGIMPDPALMRYRVPFADGDVSAASDYLDSVAFARDGRFRAVLIHHQGATSRPHKDLPDAVVRRLADAIIEAGRVPVVLDWTGESPLLKRSGVANPGAGHPLWHGRKLADPCRLAALASLSELCIGIDSGPGHVFQGAEGARALIVWTRHHPIAFGSPGDGVTHLVPRDHAANAYGPESVWGDYFRREYNHRVYDSLEALPGIITEYLG